MVEEIVELVAKLEPHGLTECGIVFSAEKSTFSTPGPRTVLIPTLPKDPSTGSVNAQVLKIVPATNDGQNLSDFIDRTASWIRYGVRADT